MYHLGTSVATKNVNNAPFLANQGFELNKN